MVARLWFVNERMTGAAAAQPSQPTSDCYPPPGTAHADRGIHSVAQVLARVHEAKHCTLICLGWLFAHVVYACLQATTWWVRPG